MAEETPQKPKGSASDSFLRNLREGALWVPKLGITGVEKLLHSQGLTDEDTHDRFQEGFHDTSAYFDGTPEERRKTVAEHDERDAEHPFASMGGNIVGGVFDPTNYLLPGAGLISGAAKTGASAGSKTLLRAAGKAAARDAAMNAGYSLAADAVDDQKELGESVPSGALIGAGFGGVIGAGGHLAGKAKRSFQAPFASGNR